MTTEGPTIHVVAFNYRNLHRADLRCSCGPIVLGTELVDHLVAYRHREPAEPEPPSAPPPPPEREVPREFI